MHHHQNHVQAKKAGIKSSPNPTHHHHPLHPNIQHTSLPNSYMTTQILIPQILIPLSCCPCGSWYPICCC